jgi:hypothetical protein
MVKISNCPNPDALQRPQITQVLPASNYILNNEIANLKPKIEK